MAFALATVALSAAGTGQAVGAAGGPSGGAQSGEEAEATADCEATASGSPYIPLDSWIYAAVMRLYSMGYLDHIYLGMRPWTAASLSHMLEDTETKIEDAQEGPVTDQARRLSDALRRELHRRMDGPCSSRRGHTRIESSYTMVRVISGTPLRDSFHLGATIVNDYGRPYQNGLNNYSGLSGYAITGRIALYVRGEFQGAPPATGYSPPLARYLATAVDSVLYYVPSSTAPYGPTTAVYQQTTIPQGAMATARRGQFLEAYVSAQVLNHVLSLGQQDEWLGPAQGASMAYSNNAGNVYAFHINRIEPLYVPQLSRLTGPFRYEFLVGALRGHTLMPNPDYPGTAPNPQPNVINPGDPWVHVEKISFRPTDNLEFGFERTVLFGGEGHSPVTLHTFLKSFFSLSAPDLATKYSRSDPGARFGAFDFSYRLPFARNWLTLYSDSEVHDDVSPISAPRRASLRPGLYLSHLPGIARLDLRAEAASTDPPVSSSYGGQFMYWEGIEKQGYTNQGQLFGDWIGREDKGGQAWMTCHLSGNEWIQAGWRGQKAARDFIAGGTTLNDFHLEVVKRVRRDFEIRGNFTLEHWKAPIDLSGEQTVTATSIQLTWFPARKAGF